MRNHELPQLIRIGSRITLISSILGGSVATLQAKYTQPSSSHVGSPNINLSGTYAENLASVGLTLNSQVDSAVEQSELFPDPIKTALVTAEGEVSIIDTTETINSYTRSTKDTIERSKIGLRTWYQSVTGEPLVFTAENYSWVLPAYWNQISGVLEPTPVPDGNESQIPVYVQLGRASNLTGVYSRPNPNRPTGRELFRTDINSLRMIAENADYVSSTTDGLVAFYLQESPPRIVAYGSPNTMSGTIDWLPADYDQAAEYDAKYEDWVATEIDGKTLMFATTKPDMPIDEITPTDAGQFLEYLGSDGINSPMLVPIRVEILPISQLLDDSRKYQNDKYFAIGDSLGWRMPAGQGRIDGVDVHYIYVGDLTKQKLPEININLAILTSIKARYHPTHPSQYATMMNEIYETLLLRDDWKVPTSDYLIKTFLHTH